MDIVAKARLELLVQQGKVVVDCDHTLLVLPLARLPDAAAEGDYLLVAPEDILVLLHPAPFLGSLHRGVKHEGLACQLKPAKIRVRLAPVVPECVERSEIPLELDTGHEVRIETAGEHVQSRTAVASLQIEVQTRPQRSVELILLRLQLHRLGIIEGELGTLDLHRQVAFRLRLDKGQPRHVLPGKQTQHPQIGLPVRFQGGLLLLAGKDVHPDLVEIRWPGHAAVHQCLYLFLIAGEVGHQHVVQFYLLVQQDDAKVDRLHLRTDGVHVDIQLPTLYLGSRLDLTAFGSGSSSVPDLLGEVGGHSVLVMRNVKLEARHVKRHLDHIGLPCRLGGNVQPRHPGKRGVLKIITLTGVDQPLLLDLRIVLVGHPDTLVKSGL